MESVPVSMDAVKGRRERRKEVRHENKKKKNEAWLEHQQWRSKQAKRRTGESKSKNVNRSGKPVTLYAEEGRGRGKDISAGRIYNLEENDVPMTSKGKPEPVRHKGSGAGLKKKKPKTKFEEYLEMEMKDSDRVAYEDLEMERKLAKKLKVKDGNVRGLDDGMDLLFKGFTSVLDEHEKFNMKEFPTRGNENGLANKKSKKQEIQEEFSEDGDILGEASELEETLGPNVGQGKDAIETSSRKRHKRRKKSKKNQEDNMASDMANGVSEPAETHNAEMAVQETLVKEPPLASSVKYVAPHLRSCAGNESEEHNQIRRRVRGLLNRLSESNVESVTVEMANIFHSISRGFSTQIISEEVLASCSGGPRGNEQYAAVFAAFVAGMACSVGMDFSAKLVASLAKCFEDEYLKADDLSLRNLTLLLSYLCVFEVVSSDLIYDFLTMLSKRLTDIDVSTILTVLQCCGIKIRGEDPTAMKNFIQSVQNRVIELKAGSAVGQTNINSKRMEFMLETICDIKNNKKRPKEETIQHTRIKKWLQKSRVEDILIRGIKWSKLLDPDKKGQWWLSGDRATTVDNVEEVAHQIDKEVLDAQKMLQLAASQRMNTDARRAIFCIIMSGEDYIDAFEKLLRLDLSGKQDREIMRVLVECCLQEKVFNKYYTVLASKLCEHDKNHKFTLQYCLWDHFKELESMPLLRSMHLAKFVAEMVTSFALSLAVLKTIEFSDVSQLTPKRAMHFRMLFEAIFDCPDKTVWNVFTRVAVAPDLETLRDGIEFFIREYVVTSNNCITKKFKVAKKALSNLEGVLM